MNDTRGGKRRLPAHIIVLLIVFWPVGLALLYQHLTLDRTAVRKNSRILGYFGIGLFVFGIIAVTLAPQARFDTGESAMLPVMAIALAFVGLGIAMFIVSQLQRKKALRYERYRSLLLYQGVDSLQELASCVKVQIPDVVADLQDMLDRGFFSGAYIDEKQGKIVLPAGREEPIRCTGCGAFNTVSAQPACCRYCGAPLKDAEPE